MAPENTTELTETCEISSKLELLKMVHGVVARSTTTRSLAGQSFSYSFYPNVSGNILGPYKLNMRVGKSDVLELKVTHCDLPLPQTVFDIKKEFSGLREKDEIVEVVNRVARRLEALLSRKQQFERFTKKYGGQIEIDPLDDSKDFCRIQFQFPVTDDKGPDTGNLLWATISLKYNLEEERPHEIHVFQRKGIDDEDEESRVLREERLFDLKEQFQETMTKMVLEEAFAEAVD